MAETRERQVMGRVGARRVTGGVAGGEALPQEVLAPAGLRRLLRFGRLGLASGRNVDDIFALLLRDLRDVGVPEEAVVRLESLGPNVLRSGTVPAAVTKLAGGPANVREIQSSLRMARSATKGFTGSTLKSAYDDFLKILRAAGADHPDTGRVIAEIEKLGPKGLSKVGATTTLSALVRRGPDPVAMRIYQRVAQKAPTPTLSEGVKQVLTQVGEGKVPAVPGAARSELAKAGVSGVGKLARVARGAGRALTGTSPWGAAIGAVATTAFVGPRVMERLGRGKRARQAAMAGFGQLGPSSSPEFLKNIVDQQEAVTRRQVVLSRYEPELFNRILQVLADQGQQPGALTASERQIGTPVGAGYTGRRSAREVEFLLDQLLRQLG